MIAPPPPKQVLAALWRLAGQPAPALEAVELTGSEPVLPSSFAVGTAAQTTVAASALAAAELWRIAHRTAAASQRGDARRGDRDAQRALSRDRREAGRRSSRPDRRPLPLRRRPLGAAAHQPAASPRRHAQAARLRPRSRIGAAGAGRMGGLRGRGRCRRGRSGGDGDALLRRMGRASARPRRRRVCRHSASKRSAMRRAEPLPAGRPPAVRHQGAGPHARDRRAGVRAHARRRTAPTCC